MPSQLHQVHTLLGPVPCQCSIGVDHDVPDDDVAAERRMVWRIQDTKYGQIAGPEFDTRKEAQAHKRTSPFYGNARRYRVVECPSEGDGDG